MSETVKPFSDSVAEYIRACRAKPHPESYLISVLQKVQTEQGYLSRESMDEVSQMMQVPVSQVTGVATFYHFFQFKPKGRHTVTVCMGTACFVRGAGKVLEKLSEVLKIQVGETTPDGEFSIEQARCLGACAMAPIVVVDGRVYGNVQPPDVVRILEEHGLKS